MDRDYFSDRITGLGHPNECRVDVYIHIDPSTELCVDLTFLLEIDMYALTFKSFSMLS